MSSVVEGQSPESRSAEVEVEICPYRGLLPFGEEDAGNYSGREDDAAKLVELVLGDPLVAVVGQAGSGKSSLVHAGLVPVLRERPDGRVWNVVSIRPGAIDELARARLDEQTGSDRLLLLVDPFEELYTLARGLGGADAFIDLLLQASRAESTTVVLTIRADWYDALLEHPELAAAVRGNVLRLGPLSREALASCIVRPATAVSLAVDADVVSAMLDEVGDDAGKLPLLQYALAETWRNREPESGQLTLEAYAGAGRIDGAIGERAEQVYAELSEKERQAARRLFVNLVTLGEGREDTEAPAAMPEDRNAERVVDRYCATDVRLLVAGGRDEQGQQVVEVAHEALLRSWPRFRTWVDENRESLRTRERIRGKWRHYQENGEDPSLLLPPGRALEEGRQLLSEYGDVDVDPPLRAYVERSLTAAEEPVRERERARRRRTRVYAATAVGGVVLAVLAVWQAWAAMEKAAESRARTAVAEQARANAGRERDSILRLSDAKKARDLVLEADTLWPVHPDRASAMSTWLNSAQAVIENRPLHEATFGPLQEAALPYSALPSETAAWRHHILTGLLADLDRLQGPADPSAGLVARITARYEAATTLRRRSVEDCADAWEATIAGIAASKRYGGLRIDAQVGLVPLGPDPESDLYEFAHLGSGSIPQRNPETKQLILADDMAIVFVLIPGGTFRLGAQSQDPDGPNFDPDAENNESDENGLPVEVTLSPFFLAKFECTQAQWMVLTAGEDPSWIKPGTSLSRTVVTRCHPVEMVSWEDCNQWLRRHRICLPTEAQWEYACRAGEETPWLTGREPRTLEGHANIADRFFHDPGGFKTPHSEEVGDRHVVHAPVGSFEPNAFGLYDMHGNICEWCQDAWDHRCYSTLARGAMADRTDPQGPSSQGSSKRAYRGGSWSNTAKGARSANRFRSDGPRILSFDLGVRPARSVTLD